MRRRGNAKGILILGGALAVIILLIISLFNGRKSPEEQAAEAVHQFYTYEQDGTFSESWEMFHPLMQQKFDKGYYIQDRAHVFMNHFGVTTYSYTLSEPTKVTNWAMEDGAEPLEQAIKFAIYKTYKGKYGNFTIVQDVYATELQGKWRILWDYNK
ncbi:hypothetical protein E3U55_10910 [Filobacillus milosensis]|uniref:DUF4829 domain-containing protein n=1 Tax=Filobacillus milosensis TaxID=94137 RepID=A0A4Y8IIK3_9BACI|nr:hypothetical protein [Filobacillus milosensis]TFB19220.1 hypothetical protein E3U55_10910 [Filobacillus milosensis]